MVLKMGRLDIFQGKMRGTFRVSGWKLSHWRVGECERAMGCSEVPMPVTEFPNRGIMASYQVAVWKQKQVH